MFISVVDEASRLRKVSPYKSKLLASVAPINMISEQHTRSLDRDKMMWELESVVKTYEENGVEVVQIASTEDMSNAAFAGDFGGNVEEGYTLGHFKKSIRSLERSHYRKTMRELGTPKIAEVSEGYLEGGDFAFIDEKTLAIDVTDRMSPTGVDEIRKQLGPCGYRVYAIKANPDHLHLDMCFNLVTPKLVVAYETGLPDNFLVLLEGESIKVTAGIEEIIFKYGYSVEALDDNHVMSLKQNTFINDILHRKRMEVIEVDIAELLKAGGGVYCVTFPLERY